MCAGYRMGQERAVDHLERHPFAVIEAEPIARQLANSDFSNAS
jgi:hypothetical protein